MSLDLSPEAMKAWSQNLGHSDVLTTFTSYGSIPTSRQGELIRASARQSKGAKPLQDDELAGLWQALKAHLRDGAGNAGDGGPKI